MSVCINFLLLVDVSLYLSNIYDALLKFMETSSLGDFEFRLKMMKSFHKEMITVESICSSVSIN